MAQLDRRWQATTVDCMADQWPSGDDVSVAAVRCKNRTEDQPVVISLCGYCRKLAKVDGVGAVAGFAVLF
jgi:hypothetical protein